MNATAQTVDAVSPAQLQALPRLGVGLFYVPSLPRFVREHGEALGYLAIMPDRFWADDGKGAGPRYREMEKQVELLDRVAECRPIVGHPVGLSIGSAELFDTGHVEQVARWQALYRSPWPGAGDCSSARAPPCPSPHADEGMNVPKAAARSQNPSFRGSAHPV